MRRVAAAALLPVAALLAAAVASAMDMPAGTGPEMRSGTTHTAGVAIEFAAYVPKQISILSGDTVTWSDVSRMHTVTANDESWTSPHLFNGDTFSRRFDTAGAVQYYCQIHQFMSGEIDVFDVLLDQPPVPAAPNRPYPLRGRSALPPGSLISIEADTGTGPKPVASTTVGADGGFAATVTPTSTATYRAVAGSSSSPPILLRVTDRKVFASETRRGRHRYITVRVAPASPGSTVVLQFHLRERFGWWPIAQARLDSRSTAQFPISLDRPAVSARVALTLPDGATQLALSRTWRVHR